MAGLPRINGGERHAVGLLSLCVGVSSACFFANLPLVPLVLMERDPGSLPHVGVLIATSFAIAAALSPVWGLCADRYGPRLMMQRAALLVAISYLVMAFAPSFEIMIAARVIGGCGSGLVPAALTYAVTSLPRDQQGRGLTKIGAARSAGAIIGPGIAALAAVVGSTVVMTAIAAVGASTALVARRLPNLPRTAKRPKKERTLTPHPRPRRAVLSMAGIGMALLLSGSVSTGVQTIVPLSLARAGPDAGTYVIAGSLFAIGGVATICVSRVWGKLIDARGTRVCTLISTGGTLFSLISLALFSVLVGSPWYAAAAYVGYCAFVMPVGPIVVILTAELSSATGLGQGIQNTIVQVSAALGPLLVGAFAGHFDTAFLVLIGVGAVGAGLLVVAVHTTANTARTHTRAAE